MSSLGPLYLLVSRPALFNLGWFLLPLATELRVLPLTSYLIVLSTYDSSIFFLGGRQTFLLPLILYRLYIVLSIESFIFFYNTHYFFYRYLKLSLFDCLKGIKTMKKFQTSPAKLVFTLNPDI